MLLVSGRRRELSPPAITTAFTSPTQYDLNSVVEELKQFAYDLLWTWQPRIEALFRALDPELWKSTRENPVLLLSQLGEFGLLAELERQGLAARIGDDVAVLPEGRANRWRGRGLAGRDL